MTARRFRVMWLPWMIGSVFAPGQDEKRNVARVFVAIEDQGRIAGFYSLSSFTIAIADLPPEHAKSLPRYDSIAAALIGRLARDQKVRGEGVGDG